MSIGTMTESTSVQEISLVVGDVELSGLLCRPRHPRGLVVAIHGGGARADYFDGRDHADQSLLRVAAALGYSALALDRPGHGTSAGQVGGWSTARKVDLVASALDQLEPATGGLRPVLVGHSFGAQLSLHLAARRGFAAGVALFGSGAEMTDRPTTGPLSTPGHIWDLVWGSPGLYFDGARASMTTSATSSDERTEMQSWPGQFAAVAGEVRVPVQIAFGEYEALWRIDQVALDTLLGHFVAAPIARTQVVSGAPHNVSISRVARAYHLAVLAFAEECFARDRPARGGTNGSRRAATG